MRFTCKSFLVWLFLIGYAMSPVLASSLPTKITQDEYWKLAQESLESIRALDEDSGEATEEVLIGLSNSWEKITEVEVNGSNIPIDNAHFIQMLRADQPDLKEIEEILFSLLEAHTTYPTQVFSSKDINHLHDILSQPEFAWPEAEKKPVSDWFQNMWEKFSRWLNDMLGDKPLNITINLNWLNTLSSILLILVFVFLMRTLVLDFALEMEGDTRNGTENEILTSEVAFEKAQVLSKGGDYRSAVRYLYLSALLIMDERGVLRYDRSKTNREYLHSVVQAPELAKPLEEVIEVFDNVWYGYHTLESETFKHYSDQVEELKEKKA